MPPIIVLATGLTLTWWQAALIIAAAIGAGAAAFWWLFEMDRRDRRRLDRKSR